MFQTLPQFYNSKEWRTFRDRLIHERTNPDDGILYDEFSKQPLTKSYDIVLHHIKPLTLQNVNDFSVSLNPENIMVVSQASHNEIHKRFGYCTERKIYYVYGAPCAGKTTFVQNAKGNSDIILDIDSIWEALTGTRYEKPNALKAVVFALWNELQAMVKTRTGNWERAWVIEGGAYKGVRTRKIEELGAEPIFIDTDKETCLKRLATAENRTPAQKEQWRKYIEDWFKDYTE